MSSQRQRIRPAPRQLQLAQELLDRVPPLSYDWLSREGQGFLSHVAKLVDAGVPVTWIAEPLGLDPARLYSILNRYRHRHINSEGTTT
jgi:hypothetical protein